MQNAVESRVPASTAAEPSETARRATKRTPARVLLVDDDAFTRALVTRMVASMGHRVESTESGERALEAFRVGLFDLVISDVNLPGIDGIDMIRRMVESDAALVPIVMTTRSDQQTAIRALECGVRNFLLKPFEQPSLAIRLEEALLERDRMVARLHERDQLEDQLRHADQLALLGQLAPRIAHELKTPLQVITGFAELALEDLKAGDVGEARASIEGIQTAGQEMVGLVHQIFRLGKPEEQRWALVDVAAELRRTLDTLRSLGVIKYARVDLRVEPGLSPVAGDPAQLDQVFRNLVVNAVHAMDGRPEAMLTVTARATPAGGVSVAVADTGAGIAPDVLARLFEPFFTTKRQGTGLGLSIVKSVVERHGATIEVASAPGAGTTFTIAFPPADTQRGTP